MRIRTVKPEFFLHEGLFELEKETGLPIRLAFAGLWCAADREGRFRWEPRRLGIQILPYDGHDFSRVLHALSTRGFLVHYASDTGGKRVEYGWIPGFLTHQVVNNKESESILPDPAECLILQGSDACPTRDSRVDDACHKEGKGKEGNKEQGKEGNNARVRAWTPSPDQIRVGSWFRRRDLTPWSEKELKAWKSITLHPEDLDALEARYTSTEPETAKYRRQDLLTLLNNWQGEVDKSRRWQPSQHSNVTSTGNTLFADDRNPWLEEPNP